MEEEFKFTNRYVYTDGRPPWYDHSGSVHKPYVIGITGGSASGKTSVCNAIIKQLGIQWVVLLSQDSFYRGLTTEEREKVEHYNFDHPNAFDWDTLINSIQSLKEGKSVEIPVYDFTTHSRSPITKTVYGGDVIILEGIMVFHSKLLRDQMDMKVFVDEAADIRLARRVKRDIAERGRDVQSVINQYIKFVKPAFDDFIRPSMKYSDIIIPRGAENTVAINLLVQTVREKLTERGVKTEFNSTWETKPLATIPGNVHVLESNPQVKSMLTKLRNRNTERGDFVFYSDRVNRLLLEKALDCIPSEDRTIMTPVGAQYNGKQIPKTENICAVSIMRGGSCMEAPLKAILGDVTVGQLLIQSDKKKNPRLFYVKLPKGLSNQWILLLEPTIATGQTVRMAIRTLVDHGAQESKIILVSVIAATHGLHFVSHSFPKITIVTGDVDTALDTQGYIVPGIGNYGDRYLGTEKVIKL